MRWLMLVSIVLPMCASIANGEEKDTAPRGDSPQLLMASATQKDGKIIIDIARPVEQGAGPLVVGPGIGSLPATMVMNWVVLKKFTLGKTVQAFRVDGKPVEPEAVLKALAKQKGVAVFIRANVQAKPEPFYLSLLRGDTIALVVAHKDFYPTEP